MPRGGAYGVIGEALTGWWLTAREEPRLADLEPVAERATCIAGLAVRAQSDRTDAADAARPERVEGAWFRDGETRMDDQQHELAALLRTIPIVEAGEGSTGSSSGPGDDSPSAWLWVIALVLALNPARPRPESLAPGGRSGPLWGGRLRRSDGARRVRGLGSGRLAARGSTSASPRSGSPPGSWRDWSASPTCSGDRHRPNPRSPAGAPRSSQSRSQ